MAIVEAGSERPASEWDAFSLPFGVATVDEFQQRAVVSRDDDNVVEWQWLRLHAWCEIGTAPGRMMAANRESMLQDLRRCRVQDSEWKYRGTAASSDTAATAPVTGWNFHGLGSRAFFVMILWLMKNKSLKAPAKMKALGLFLGMAGLCLASQTTGGIPSLPCW